MSPEHRVRAARLELARALMDPAQDGRGLAEAEHQLMSALDGLEGPERLELIASLADVAEQRDDTAGAASWLVEGVLGATPRDSRGLAAHALRLIENDSRGRVVESLPMDDARKLRDLAHDPDSPPELVQLAARVSLAHGQIESVVELSRQLDGAPLATSDEELMAAATANEVLSLLTEGRIEEAGQAAARLPVGGTDPTVALAEAMLSYARGDVQGARQRAESMGHTGDFAAVSVIALLSQAVEDEDPEQLLINSASTAAARAARMDPAGGAPLLLRAQVLLEAGEQLVLGRDLLKTSLGRLDSPEALAWWRVQEHVRTDDRYLFFRIEVAAAQGRSDEVARLFQGYQALRTNYAQDGRVYELAAKAEPDGGLKALLLGHATDAYRYAKDPEAVIRTLRSSYFLSDNGDTGISLAEALWSASLDEEDPGSVAVLVAEGLDVLGSVGADLGPGSLRTACVLWGLLLARRLDNQDAPAQQRWEPLPHLLTAVRLDPRESYGWAHLAWAFYGADLWWPAAWAAEQALALAPDDAWVKEGAVVMSLNWFVTLPPDLDDWLHDDAGDRPDLVWVMAVRALGLAFHGRLQEASRLVQQVTFGASWAQDQRLGILAAAGRTEELEREVRDRIDQDRQQGRLVEAAGLALWLDPELSRALLDEAVSTGTEREEKLGLDRAFLELVTTDGRSGRDEALAQLETISRRYRVLDYAEIQLTILATWHPELPGLRSTLDQLAGRMREYVSSLPLRPSLSRELDTGETWCEDPELGALVRRLLDSAEPSADVPLDLEWPDTLPGSHVLDASWAHLTRETA